jgi:hypothetical protein
MLDSFGALAVKSRFRRMPFSDLAERGFVVLPRPVRSIVVSRRGINSSCHTIFTAQTNQFHITQTLQV